MPQKAGEYLIESECAQFVGYLKEHMEDLRCLIKRRNNIGGELLDNDYTQ